MFKVESFSVDPLSQPSDIYYAKYYGKGGGNWQAGGKNWKKMKEGKEKGGKLQ